MKRIRLFFLFLLAIPFHFLFSKEKYSEPFFLITLAKSGSHLILKAISEITGLPPVWVSSGDSQAKNLYAKNQYPWTHFCISTNLKRHLEGRKVIIMVRDLRDLCISATYGLKNDFVHGQIPKISLPNFEKLSFEDQLLSVLEETSRMRAKDPALVWNFSDSFPQAVAFARNPDVLVCRYEDLIGPEGGGDRESQYREIERIADYLEIALDSSEVKRIGSVIYGDSKTFRKGRIHGWKAVFNEKHKALFKMRFSEYLRALGYEEDDQW